MSSDDARPRRPLPSGPALFDAISGGSDPAAARAAGELLAEALVRREGERDQELIQRIVKLAEVEGLDALADLWAEAPARSLGGALWRLYLLRESVRLDPQGSARAFDEGRNDAPVATAIAGAVEPYGPDQMLTLLDIILRGISVAEFADVLARAGAFARVVAAGRVRLTEGHAAALSTSRFLDLARDLEAAARLELEGKLG
ncbi:MAG: hypothetical protein ACTHOG_06010 [Marmoricola sp.]